MSNKSITVGDQVRFLNEVGGGRVTAIINKDMVLYKSEWVAHAGFIFAKSNFPVKM